MYFDEYSCGVVAALPNITVLPFIERMDYAYAAADAVVCRAGALTISEIALINKPAVLLHQMLPKTIKRKMQWPW